MRAYVCIEMPGLLVFRHIRSEVATGELSERQLGDVEGKTGAVPEGKQLDAHVQASAELQTEYECCVFYTRAGIAT